MFHILTWREADITQVQVEKQVLCESMWFFSFFYEENSGSEKRNIKVLLGRNNIRFNSVHSHQMIVL